jgi:hypothetical protein
VATTELPGIRFCSSQSLSEHSLEKIRSLLRGLAPNVKAIEVEGAEQLQTIITRHRTYSSIFERFYPGEIGECHAFLASRDLDDATAVSGMRIALSTQLTNDGEGLRSDLLHNLVLTALLDERSRTQSGIAKLLSDSLYLGRIVHDAYISSALTHLEDNGLITKHHGKMFKITEKGKQNAASRAASGAEMLGEGQTLLRESITLLSGQSLPERDYLEVWRIVKEELSELLYLSGMQTIDALASLAEQPEQGLFGRVDLVERIKRMGAKIVAQLGNTPISKDIGQAVVDAFHDATTAIFDWFTKLCACYTAICALGLSEDAQRAIVRRLRKMDLFLDTDIALSLLAEGEPDHEKVRTLIEGWQKVGGTIHVAIPVLEELAYHASISELDFREVFHQLPSYSEPDARRLITNAFVRGYWAATKRLKSRFSFRAWREYISNFHGRNETDYSRISDDLASISVQPREKEIGDPEFAKKVTAFISQQRGGPAAHANSKVLARALDKSLRDGRLVADIFAFRSARRSSQATAVIVSSSPRLAKVCREPELALGDDPLVLSVASLAYLLSLVPGAHISLVGLRKLLFDTRFHEHVTALERRALRVLHNSQEFSLPFARRARLDHEMMNRIKKVAEERGTKLRVVFEEFDARSEESSRLFAEIVRDSVDSITRSESEKEILRLQAENARLREELGRSKAN